jgi:RNA polymerase sigma factor (sigma-70 family)
MGAGTYKEFTDFENRLVGRLASALSRRYGMSRQEQEDAEQEFAVRLWAKKSNYDKDHPSQSSYEAYLTRYLEKYSFEILKAVRPETVLNETGEVETASGPAPSIEKRAVSTESTVMFRVLLAAAYSKLTPEQKELFTQIASGETIKEISADTGVPRPTLYARLHRMRRVLHEIGLNVTADKTNERRHHTQ